MQSGLTVQRLSSQLRITPVISNQNAEISKFVCAAAIIFSIGQFVSQVEIRFKKVVCENFFFAVGELCEVFLIGQQDDESAGPHIIRRVHESGCDIAGQSLLYTL